MCQMLRHYQANLRVDAMKGNGISANGIHVAAAAPQCDLWGTGVDVLIDNFDIRSFETMPISFLLMV